MRFLFRWAFRLFLVIVILVVALVLLKDTLLKSYLESRVRAETGMDVKIGKLEVGLFSPTLTIEDFKLYNAAEFGGSPLLDVPEFHLECDAAALASQRLRAKLVRAHVRELNIVESQTGRTNVNNWMAGLEQLASENGPGKTINGTQFAGIDTLNLTLGKIKYSSLKRPGKFSEVDLGLKNQIFTNVQSFADLYSLLVKILFQKGISISSQSAPALSRPAVNQPRAPENTRLSHGPSGTRRK